MPACATICFAIALFASIGSTLHCRSQSMYLRMIRGGTEDLLFKGDASTKAWKLNVPSACSLLVQIRKQYRHDMVLHSALCSAADSMHAYMQIVSTASSVAWFLVTPVVDCVGAQDVCNSQRPIAHVCPKFQRSLHDNELTSLMFSGQTMQAMQVQFRLLPTFAEALATAASRIWPLTSPMFMSQELLRA